MKPKPGRMENETWLVRQLKKESDVPTGIQGVRKRGGAERLKQGFNDREGNLLQMQQPTGNGRAQRGLTERRAGEDRAHIGEGVTSQGRKSSRQTDLTAEERVGSENCKMKGTRYASRAASEKTVTRAMLTGEQTRNSRASHSKVSCVTN